MTAAYRKFLPHINNNYDFAELLSEYLGELNVSHTGGRFRPQTSGNITANLGLLFDWNHSGKGLLIAEVVEKRPVRSRTFQSESRYHHGENRRTGNNPGYGLLQAIKQ